MRIGIDGLFLRGNLSGIGRYIFEICKELDRVLPEAEFIVYSNIPVKMPVVNKRWRLNTDVNSSVKYLRGVMWLKCRVGLLCKRDRVDLFWGGATFLPNVGRNVKTIVTVHDLNFLIVKETMRLFTYWAHRLFFVSDIKKADAVVTNSYGTAKRVSEKIGCNVRAVVRPGISDIFKRLSEKEINEHKKLYNIKFPYILAVGTQEPRKNLERVIEAFLFLKETGFLREHRLLLVGSMGWKNKRLISLVEGSKEVIHVGYVPYEHLPGFYNGADVFVYPSLYEGYGIPVMEARACGTKIVTTDIPELHEAGGADAIYIDPTVEGIARGIVKALDRKTNLLPDRSSIPSWGNGAKILADVIREVLNR